MHSLIKSTLIILLLLYGQLSIAEIRTYVSRSEIDSLIGQLPEYEGTKLADHLNLIATSISQRYPDSCLYFAEKALELSKSLKYKYGEAVAVFNIGNAYFFKVDVKNAMSNYLSSMRIFENLSSEMASLTLSNVYLQIGEINRFIGNDLNAAKYYHKAISIYEKLKLTKDLILARDRLSFSFVQAQLYDSAFYYSGLNIVDCKKFSHPELLSKMYNNYGIIHLWRDDRRPENKRFEGTLAVPYFDTAINYASQYHEDYYIITPLTNLAECYHHYMVPQNYTLGEKYYKLSIKYARNIKHWDGYTSNFTLLGELYADVGKLTLSEVYLDSSLMEIKNVYSNIETAVFRESWRKLFIINYMYWLRSYHYRACYKLYKSLGNYDSAFYYLQKKEDILDSLQQVKYKNQISYLLANEENRNIQNKMRIMEQQTELEKNRTQRSLYFIIGLILLLIIALILIRQNRLKAYQEKTDLQQRLFRLQMKPHFLYNSLASIQNFIIHKNPSEASSYLSKFAKLVRQILNSSTTEYITLDEELVSIENYLALQKIRYSDMFDYRISLDEKIDTETTAIPPMLAQPFIENSIEHGIKHMGSTGLVSVSIKANDGYFIMVIEDNGVGRSKAKELEKTERKDHKSMATNITTDRLDVLNKKLKQMIHFEIIDLKDDKGNAIGTKVVFEIPLSL